MQIAKTSSFSLFGLELPYFLLSLGRYFANAVRLVKQSIRLFYFEKVSDSVCLLWNLKNCFTI